MEAKMALGKPLSAKPEETKRSTMPVKKSAPMSAQPAGRASEVGQTKANTINVKAGGGKDGYVLQVLGGMYKSIDS